MNYDEFVEGYFRLAALVLKLHRKARREGLLALEKDIDPQRAEAREILEYGIQFVVDGIDPAIIDKILSRVITHEKDPYRALLKTVEKEAVLAIQQGLNVRLLAHLLQSFVDIPLSDPRFKNIMTDETPPAP